MTSIQALRERLAALNKKMNHLLAEKGAQTWSKEDQAVFDLDSEEAERVQRQIDAHQKQLDANREDNFEDARRLDPKDAKKSAMREGLEIFLRKSAREMSHEEALKVRNVMSTTTGSEGGFTVQTLVATDFIDLLKAYGFMRKVASQITTENGADLSYPTTDGTGEVGELVTQNSTAATADPVFATRALNTFKYGSKTITIPIELLQDTSIDIIGLVNTRARDRIGRICNQHFTTGTGSGQPFGVIPAASVGKTGTTGQTLTIIYDDLVDLIDSLDAAYLDMPNTVPQDPGAEPGWMMSQTMRRVVRKIKDTAGRPIWTPSYDEGFTTGLVDRLLGYPVYLNNDLAVPAANAKSLAFGNFHKYMIRDAMQVQMFRFDDSPFVTKGQIGFLAWARAGGNLLDVNAVKVYQHSAT
jgi:HK97 family phage major capsid protein